MSSNRRIRGRFSGSNKDQRRALSVSEVARFLKRLSSFYRDPKTGNPALSEALAELALALSRRRDLSLTDAASAIDASPKGIGSLNVARLKNLTLKEVKKLLSETARTKADFIDLGVERFAIPRAGLKRMNKDQVSDAIWAAVRNEESLDIISREAQRGGEERSS